MGYRTVDEWENFSFKDAGIIKIQEENGHVFMTLAYVTILGNNSCNRDICDMGTNQLELKLQNATDISLVLEGFKSYDADGNLKGQEEDTVIFEPDRANAYRDLENSAIYSATKEGNQYHFYIDTEERTYAFQLTAEHDVEEWERFMKREAGY